MSVMITYRGRRLLSAKGHGYVARIAAKSEAGHLLEKSKHHLLQTSDFFMRFSTIRAMVVMAYQGLKAHVLPVKHPPHAPFKARLCTQLTEDLLRGLWESR